MPKALSRAGRLFYVLQSYFSKHKYELEVCKPRFTDKGGKKENEGSDQKAAVQNCNQDIVMFSS